MALNIFMIEQEHTYLKNILLTIKKKYLELIQISTEHTYKVQNYLRNVSQGRPRFKEL